MFRRPPNLTRTHTPFPHPTLVLSHWPSMPTWNDSLATDCSSTPPRPATRKGSHMPHKTLIEGYPHQIGGHCGSGAMRDLLHWHGLGWDGPPSEGLTFTDRKSTRLNSSH